MKKEMNISIIHSSLNKMGGAERLCLTVIEAFKEAGHRVVLGTFEPTNWVAVQNFFGKIIKPDLEIITPKMTSLLRGIYGEMIRSFFLASKLRIQSDITFNTHGEVLCYDLPANRLITYMHFPPFPSKKYRKGLWSLYYRPYRTFQSKCFNNPNSRVVLTNSSFSAQMIRKIFDNDSVVVYPPIDVENFHPSEKENLVVSVGRFVPKKKFETLINAFREVTADAQCIIIGSSDRNRSRKYISDLKGLIKKLGLRERVKLLVDCPLEQLELIFSKAKLYVHCMPFEHFGISIVEAMASGCIPIVHRSGGPYSDIIDHDRYGFSFDCQEELARKINQLLKDTATFREYYVEVLKKSETFSKDRFKQAILNVTKRLIESI